MRLPDVENEFIKACARRMANDLANAVAKVAADWPGWSFMTTEIDADREDSVAGRFTMTAIVEITFDDAVRSDASYVTMWLDHEAAYIDRLQEEVEARVARLALEWAFGNRGADGFVTIDDGSFKTVKSAELREAVARRAARVSDATGEPFDSAGALDTILSWADGDSIEGFTLEYVHGETWRFVADGDE